MANGTSKQLQKIQQVVAAAAQYLPAKTTLTLDGQPVTLAAFIATLNAAIAASTAVTTAEAQLASARSTRTTSVAAATTYVSALKQFLTVTYGKTALLLSQFGFSPKARTVPTPAQVAIAVAQRKLTRQVRGTMGPKQRLDVTAAGKLGLLLVSADGTPIPGVVQGPVAPGIPTDAAPAETAPVSSKPPIAG